MHADNVVAYSSADDSVLRQLMLSGDNKAADTLIKRYYPLIRSRANELCRSSTVEREDLSQEGLIGLLFAVNSFDYEKGASFRTYAMLCAERMMLSRLRHENKNSAIPRERLVYIDSGESRDIAASSSSEPESIIISGEETERISRKINSDLTELEKRTFLLYLSGCSYLEIAQRINASPKTVDNALQRVRRKLRQ
ncbi:MAG: sigma-70 family RNA polymerase sigma factor [Clostridia bacterium]|nr:sigma-70 family RNA polymerase sigma factor [Clostridia bacterium]